MSDGNGSMTTPRPSIRYTRRFTEKLIKASVYLEPDLMAFAKRYCKVNRQSFSNLVTELLLWLRDEA